MCLKLYFSLFPLQFSNKILYLINHASIEAKYVFTKFLNHSNVLAYCFSIYT